MPTTVSTARITPAIDGSYILSGESAYAPGGSTITGTYIASGYQEPYTITLGELVADPVRTVYATPVSNATVQSASTTVTLNESWHGSRTDVAIGSIPTTNTITVSPGNIFTWDTLDDPDIIRWCNTDTGIPSIDELADIPLSDQTKEPEPECVDVDETEWAELLTES